MATLAPQLNYFKEDFTMKETIEAINRIAEELYNLTRLRGEATEGDISLWRDEIAEISEKLDELQESIAGR